MYKILTQIHLHYKFKKITFKKYSDSRIVSVITWVRELKSLME